MQDHLGWVRTSVTVRGCVKSSETVPDSLEFYFFTCEFRVPRDYVSVSLCVHVPPGKWAPSREAIRTGGQRGADSSAKVESVLYLAILSREMCKCCLTRDFAEFPLFCNGPTVLVTRASFLCLFFIYFLYNFFFLTFTAAWNDVKRFVNCLCSTTCLPVMVLWFLFHVCSCLFPFFFQLATARIFHWNSSRVGRQSVSSTS